MPYQVSYRPMVTLFLVAALIVMGIVTNLNPDFSQIMEQWANNPSAVIADGEWHRLLTSMFLHIHVLHMLLNANLLFIMGQSLERKIGHWRFLLVYMVGGIGGGLAHTFFAHMAGLGASGAIYAILGADAVILHRYRQTLSKGERIYLYFLVGIGGAGLILGLLLSLLPFPLQADNTAHLGGLITGVIIGWILLRRTKNE